MHGKSKRRKWIKIHIAVDAISQETIDLEVTESSVADCTAGAKIIAKCPKSATSYLADGAYDTRQCREAIAKKGARALIPPRKNGRKLPGMEERNRAISERKGLGSDEVGLSLWGKLTGYSKRALVETGFSRLKTLYGGQFYWRKMPTQKVEGHLKALMMNEMLRKVG